MHTFLKTIDVTSRKYLAADCFLNSQNASDKLGEFSKSVFDHSPLTGKEGKEEESREIFRVTY